MVGEIFFSIIIPTYNRAGLVKTSIQSVIHQKYRNFELLVIDDGSTDNTQEVVESFSVDYIRYYKIQNSERAFARNYGMAQSKGDYLTFLDSDDIYYPDYLANAAASIVKYNFPSFFHLAYEFKSSQTGKAIRKYIILNDNIKSLVKGNHLSCLGIFLKREITGSFRFNEDRNLSGSEDWELWLRLAANFGLKTDHRISGALITHDARSVLNYPEEKLLLRKNLALKYAFEDKAVKEKFGDYKKAMEGYCDTYISLHLALSGSSIKALHYLSRACFTYPLAVINIRTLAIFKFLIFNLLGMRKKE